MHPSRGALLAACAALLLAGAACSSDDSADSAQALQVRLYGADGNMSNDFGKAFKDQPGVLAGMKGTAPLPQLTEDFKARLRTVDAKLANFIFSAETYDAVVITILAAELAGTTEPRQVARYINGVTTGGKPCDTVRACLQLARDGKDLQYQGVSLRRGGFTDVGEPSTASYATLHYSKTDKLDDAKMEFVGAGDEAAATKQRPPDPRRNRDDRADGSPLKLGGLMPKTGALDYAYPPMIAGARLAIKEANAVGGALGEPVDFIEGDDGTSNADKAKQTVDAHVGAGVHAIIGAGASSISKAVLPDCVRAGVILFSPSNTAADLSKADDKGFYFRTAPSDLLQGKALTDVIVRDGTRKIAIVARSDAYGLGLQENVKTELEKVGISGGQVMTVAYTPPGEGAALGFSKGANDIKSFGADAVLIIGFGESADVIKALVAAGIQLRH
jgi:ABC-type branched-subunit amino acid transport system substrate-binding protein